MILAAAPMVAQAVNCEFGCKGSHCHAVPAATVITSEPLQYGFGNAIVFPSLASPAVPPAAHLSDICDQFATQHHAGSAIVYVERAFVSQPVHRHRIDFDLGGVRAYVYPGNGAFSWWHGMVTWGFADQPQLSVDYTGSFDPGYLHYQRRLRLRLDQEVIAEFSPGSTQVAIELIWGGTGPLKVAIAEFDGTPVNRKIAPTRLTELELAGTEAMNLMPSFVVIGRSGNGPELASTGVLKAASNLVLTPPAN